MSLKTPLVPIACDPEVKAEYHRKKACAKRDHMRRASAKREAQMSWLQCFLATVFAALFGAYFLGLIAVAAPDYNATFGVALGAGSVAFGYAAVIYAVGVTFGQFNAAHLAPHVTIAAWLDDRNRFSAGAIVRMLSIFGAELAGFLLAALTASFLLNGAAAPLGCAVQAGGVGLVQQGLAALLVKLLVGHIFLLSARRHKNGPFATLAIALTVAAGILSLGPVSGGAYGLWRYLGVGIIEGGACLTARGALIELVTDVIAAGLNFLLARVLFTRACSSMGACDKKAKENKAAKKDC